MEVLLDEIESLEAILMDDVRIYKNSETGAPEMIETTIFPSVEDESEEQYICVTLQVIPFEGYPEVSPKFNLLTPRGLDDYRLNAIRMACVEKLKETQGFPVVFDLIEVVREHLSGSNLPCGQCVVCLYGFREGDEFTKTKCYHYLHSYCLARHLIASRKNYQEEHDKLPAWIRKAAEPFKASCPVCRETIDDEGDSLKACLPPIDLTNAPEFQLTDEMVNLQKKMANLFVQQKKKGGIIDVEAEVCSVISIEPTDCITEDQGSKHNDKESSNNFEEDRLSLDHKTLKKSGCSGETSVRNQRTAHSRKTNNANNELNKTEANASTNFAPVVTQSQRMVSDPTNNNYHLHSSRRHYRGRRSNHHHHHRSDAANHLRAISPSAGQTSSQSNSNKQQKGTANCSASTR